MACPVEYIRVKQVAIPVRQQSEADVALAVPKLPRHKPQHLVGGRKVQELVEILFRIELIENVCVLFLALGRPFILERERCVTLVESDRHNCVVDLSIDDTQHRIP